MKNNLEMELIYTVNDVTNLVFEIGLTAFIDEVVDQLNERGYQFTDAEKEAMLALWDKWEM
jgi:hypothetical protein